MASREDLRRTLLDADIARARARRHRRCPEHGRVAVVCLGCARVYCPRCTPECPRCDRPWRRFRVVEAPRGPKAPRPTAIAPVAPVNPVLRPVWTLLQPLGATGVAAHEDSGGWVATFPCPLPGVATSGDLAARVFGALAPVAVPTPFGCGRTAKPDAWYATFLLK